MPRAPIDLAEFARLEESRKPSSVARIADEFEEIAGGTMCFGGVGSWANQAMGLGMDGPVATDGRRPPHRVLRIARRRAEGRAVPVRRRVARARAGRSRRSSARVRERAGAGPARWSPPPTHAGRDELCRSTRQTSGRSRHISRSRARLRAGRPGLVRAARAPHDRPARRARRSSRRSMANPPRRGSGEVAPPCAALFGLDHA